MSNRVYIGGIIVRRSYLTRCGTMF